MIQVARTHWGTGRASPGVGRPAPQGAGAVRAGCPCRGGLPSRGSARQRAGLVGWVMYLGSIAGRAPRAVAAAVVPEAFGSRVGGQGHRASSRHENQATRRSRSAAHRIGWVATGRSPLLGVGGLPQARSALACSRPAALACQAALRPGHRRRRATAGRRTARPGRIGWQVLLILARMRVATGVTKQYELVRKVKISGIARSGTSG